MKLRARSTLNTHIRCQLKLALRILLTMSSTDATRNVLAFDIYGTILNTNSVGTTLQSLLSISEEQANAVCLLWRRYQLE